MVNDRLARTPGGQYFFTGVTFDRKPILCHEKYIIAVRQSFYQVIKTYPFKIDGIVILPDHLHTIWSMEDDNFSLRWELIKKKFTQIISSSEHKSRLWQPRFWEHVIRDDRDFKTHIEYIHFNPVKHRLVNSPKDWKYSSFHQYVKRGIYTSDWGDQINSTGDDMGEP